MTFVGEADEESAWRPADLRRLHEMAAVARVDFHRELGSTNDHAKTLTGGAAELPCLILAERQTAGRGRGANRWWAADGALTFSLLLDASHLPASRRSLASLAAAIAVAEAVGECAPSVATMLKWPNDVFVGDRKLSGILVEADANRLILGVGVNVNNSMTNAPPKIRQTAAALCDLLAGEAPRTELLASIVNRLVRYCSGLPAAWSDLANVWRRRCLLTDRVVRIDVAGRIVAGRCRGIDDDGALLVATSEGMETLYSGVVLQY